MLPGTGQSFKLLLPVARDLKKRVMDRAEKNDGEFAILIQLQPWNMTPRFSARSECSTHFFYSAPKNFTSVSILPTWL